MKRRMSVAEAVSRRVRAGSTQLLAGSILMPLGLAVIGLGWYGVARTYRPHEQTAYLVSGGLLGLALSVVGGFLFFSYWVSESARQAARHHRETTELLGRLLEGRGEQPPALVMTASGTLAHLPTCQVVAGKSVRPVAAGGPLKLCRMCLTDGEVPGVASAR